jgi:hypothetical protein
MADILRFIWGMRRDLLGNMFKVATLRNHTDIPPGSLVVQPLLNLGVGENAHQGLVMQNPNIAEALHQPVRQQWNLTVAGCQSGKKWPVIGILDCTAKLG